MLDITIDAPVGNPAAISAAVSLALGKALQSPVSGYPSDPKPEKFTKELRQSVYKTMGLTANQCSAIEGMVLEAPYRKPGKGALDNLICCVSSLKNSAQRWLESHTVERLFYYCIERDPDVVGYVTQVRCRGITRDVKKGKHVSNATLDFLVFYKDRIVLVECKTEDMLEKLAQKREFEWIRDEAGWANTAYEDFARKLGIEARVFSVERLFSTELQNAELISSELRADDSDHEARLRRAAAVVLRDRPLTIEQVAERLPGFTVRTAAKMLGEGSAFGLERIISLGDEDAFLLFSAAGHRDIVDAELHQDQLDETAELRISDRLLLAKSSHVEFSRKRWERLQRIAEGIESPTKRMTALSNVVSLAIASGTSPIEACLSSHEKSGNRDRRLEPKQIANIDDVAERWNKGKFPDRFEAWLELERLCKSDEIPVPHISTLNKTIKKTNQTRRTLIIDGIRQYQKDKARTDGGRCSLPSIIFGHTLIVDSSNFDQRVAANLLTHFPSSVPRFYAGVDGATGFPMAHSLLFGPARTDGLAILMREFVWRYGFLPRCIQLDRGPENTGSWILEFAEHYAIELRWPPTGGSRYNGLAENVIGRVNHHVAHKGVGSTLPDQKGRAKDGRMKSRKTAANNFECIVRQFDGYYYGELATTRDSESLSPTDRRDYSLRIAGNGGIPCKMDDAFRVMTSIKVDVPKTVEPSRGIRLTEGAYAGAALNAALQDDHITELRKDCINPFAIYAKVGGKWYRAFRRDCAPLLCRSVEWRLFKLLSEPTWRSERAAHNIEQRRITNERRQAEMSEARAGKEHLTVADDKPEEAKVDQEAKKIVYPKVDWSRIAAGNAA